MPSDYEFVFYQNDRCDMPVFTRYADGEEVGDVDDLVENEIVTIQKLTADRSTRDYVDLFHESTKTFRIKDIFWFADCGEWTFVLTPVYPASETLGA